MTKTSVSKDMLETLKTISECHKHVFVLDVETMLEKRKECLFSVLKLDQCSKLPTSKKICPDSMCLEHLYQSSLKELEDSEGTNHELFWNVLSQFFSASTKKDCLPQVRAFLSSLFANDHQSHMYEDEVFFKLVAATSSRDYFSVGKRGVPKKTDPKPDMVKKQLCITVDHLVLEQHQLAVLTFTLTGPNRD
ncbi:uncharacterized protein [Watersipora subatra]|uniref:uncharacterized protein n=1 Tax=Watersipora subatra TaxID=2589382 RepID=UPI00355C844B